MRRTGESPGWSQTVWGQTAAVPFAMGVMLGKLLNFFVPKFPHWKNGDNNSTYLIRWF